MTVVVAAIAASGPIRMLNAIKPIIECIFTAILPACVVPDNLLFKTIARAAKENNCAKVYFS